jgi:Glyoxalase/Bleomycin resistance protein/Dioxygenase superfamily
MDTTKSGIHFSSIAPCFPVADISATLLWYKQLGFQTDPFPDREPYVFAIIRRDNIEIMLQRLSDYEKPDLYARRPGGVWDAYFRLEGLREFYEFVKDRVTLVQPLRRQPYGAWEFEVKDPNGYVLVFSEG